MTPAEMGAEEDSITANENRAVMAAIVGLGNLYALISVLITLAISITQRGSEIATLRISGLTRRQIYGTTVLEALASTLIGLLHGATAAVLALWGCGVRPNRSTARPSSLSRGRCWAGSRCAPPRSRP